MDGLKIEGLSGFANVNGPSGSVQEKVLGRFEQPTSEPLLGGDSSFGEMLVKSLEEVNRHQVEADRAVKEFIAGRNKNPHETMLAIEKADMSLKLMMQVRNKVLDAYREIMRMQV